MTTNEELAARVQRDAENEVWPASTTAETAPAGDVCWTCGSDAAFPVTRCTSAFHWVKAEAEHRSLLADRAVLNGLREDNERMRGVIGKAVAALGTAWMSVKHGSGENGYCPHPVCVVERELRAALDPAPSPETTTGETR